MVLVTSSRTEDGSFPVLERSGNARKKFYSKCKDCAFGDIGYFKMKLYM